MRRFVSHHLTSSVLTTLAAVMLTAACTGGASDTSGGDTAPSGPETLAAACGSPDGTEGAQATPSAISAAEQEGINKELADRLSAEFGPPGYEALRSALVIVDGRTAFEEYFDGGRDDYHHVWSVTKSVVATLVGIAIDEGHLESVDQKLADLLPQHAASMSPEVAGTTLEQLLTMTGGFLEAWPSGPVYVSEGAVPAILAQQYGTPGDFGYSNGGAHLVSAILVEATGMSVLEYARKALFEPLEIATMPASEPVLPEDFATFEKSGFAWGVDAQGIQVGAFGLRLRAQDMAKIGLLYLQNGSWEGEQVVPEEWVRAATSPHVQVDPEVDPDCYGYEWWVPRPQDGSPRSYAAVGYGGQAILVVPDIESVIVFQTDTRFGDQDVTSERLAAAVDSIIVPALTP